MSELFYVYEHLRNDTNQIFYVGKGKVGSGRSNITFGRNQYWKRVVKKANGFRVHKVVENVSELFAFQKEIERIAELKSAGIRLCNMTDGGDGFIDVLTRNKKNTKQSDCSVVNSINETIQSSFVIIENEKLNMETKKLLQLKSTTKILSPALPQALK